MSRNLPQPNPERTAFRMAMRRAEKADLAAAKRAESLAYFMGQNVALAQVQLNEARTAHDLPFKTRIAAYDAAFADRWPGRH